MQIAPHRLLGFAFASADLLLEIGPDETISFAVGAAATLAGKAEGALIGRRWRQYVDPRDQDLVEALFLGLEDAGRRGPVIARLVNQPDRAFAVCACRLPQNNGMISCAVSRAKPPQTGAGENGLHDRDAFEIVTKGLFETARATGEELELALIEAGGLAAATKSLPAETARALQARLAGALRAQSHGGAAAAALGDDRFALVRPAGESTQAMTGRLSRLMGLVADSAELKIAANVITLNGEMPAARIVKAIRYALDDFIRDGPGDRPAMNLEDAVNQSVRHTLEKASALGSAVADRKFDLVYQPVVRLKTGELHHHEVLLRFGDDASPFPTIRMAEELDLIEGLDLAVCERVVGQLRKETKQALAVNISGRTIISPGFVSRIAEMIGAKNALGGRLMFEITESAAIDDLGLADRHIQVLRGLGCMVCLDDFGAGAASLAYLQQLRLDVVKIDGRYIRDLQHGGRESTFIRHLVHMCSELKVRTVAEMVETVQVEEAVRRAGVDFAQGWLYGAAAATPERPASRNGPSAARRVGAVESWG